VSRVQTRLLLLLSALGAIASVLASGYTGW
jgi:hypothetical protein